jgi:hypothetical protein
MEDERRGAVGADDLDVLPADGPSFLAPGERLVRRLLGGEARGEMHRGTTPRGGVGLLPGGEEAVLRARAMARDERLDPRDGDEIEPHPDDHAVLSSTRRQKAPRRPALSASRGTIAPHHRSTAVKRVRSASIHRTRASAATDASADGATRIQRAAAASSARAAQT